MPSLLILCIATKSILGTHWEENVSLCPELCIRCLLRYLWCTMLSRPPRTFQVQGFTAPVWRSPVLEDSLGYACCTTFWILPFFPPLCLGTWLQGPCLASATVSTTFAYVFTESLISTCIYFASKEFIYCVCTCVDLIALHHHLCTYISGTILWTLTVLVEDMPVFKVRVNKCQKFFLGLYSPPQILSCSLTLWLY